jgi:flagellar protein FliO/FliZ
VVEVAVRVVFSLAVVFGLIWLVARTSTRRFGGAARSMVRVVARQPLARSASLAVVEVGERVLVVGVSEHGVSLLTEMDPAELPAPEAEAAPSAPSPVPGAAPAAQVTTRPAGLGGSVLSSQTWKQAWAAATTRNGASSD